MRQRLADLIRTLAGLIAQPEHLHPPVTVRPHREWYGDSQALTPPMPPLPPEAAVPVDGVQPEAPPEHGT